MATGRYCITSCTKFVGRLQRPGIRISASQRCPNSTHLPRSLADLTAVNQCRSTAPFFPSVSISVAASASSATGALHEGLEDSANEVIGANDLLIVGPGVLGRIVAEKWQKEYPGSQVYGQTLTSDHHEELMKLGINPCFKGTLKAHKFPYVIFCAPPSRNPDYPSEVREAILKWNGEGSFLFTSSSGLYDCSDNGSCDEDSPVVPLGRSPRTDNLLNVESMVLEASGCVVRLAGLYKADRGAHTYWLKKGSVDIRPDHIINLLHYEDAASISISILQKKFRGGIYLGCDNAPLSRQEVMELVSECGKFHERFEGFTGKITAKEEALGKKLNNSKTRAELGWEPKYPSFAKFLQSL